MEKTIESNLNQIKTTVSGRLQRRVILRMLMDSESWELRYRGTKVEDMVHKDGWRYYTGCGCICIRNDNDRNFSQHSGIFIYPLYAIIGYINTRKARAR